MATSTKDRLLDAGLAMLLERGYNDMGVQALLDATGVTKGSFYHHFRDKEDFALQVVDRYMDEVHAGLDQCLGDAADLPWRGYAASSRRCRRSTGARGTWGACWEAWGRSSRARATCSAGRSRSASPPSPGASPACLEEAAAGATYLRRPTAGPWPTSWWTAGRARAAHPLRRDPAPLQARCSTSTSGPPAPVSAYARRCWLPFFAPDWTDRSVQAHPERFPLRPSLPPRRFP